MSDRMYDKFGARAAFNIPGITVTGTNASDTQLAGTKIVCPFPLKVTAAKRIHTTASTAAVASWTMLIQKSVGGTGTFSTIGTFSCAGTEASNVTGTGALSSTAATVKFAENDVIAIAVASATNARNDVANFQIAYEELPN